MRVDNKVDEIDVVIPTRDRPGQLLATLEALTAQSFRDFGVIVVDDGSRSPAETAIPPGIRNALGARFVRNDKSVGAGPARNRGVACSSAKYVVFIDDDCVAGPHLIRQHYRALSTVDEPVVSLGPILSEHEHRLPAWLHWDAFQLDRMYSNIASGRETPAWDHLFTGNVGLRRSEFLAVGGFDEHLPRGEDIELGYRLGVHGCRFRFDPEASVRHDSQRSLRGWKRIAAAAALSDIEMQRREPSSDRLAMVAKQLGSRHWALRLVRRLFGGPVAGRWTIISATSLGLFLHAVHVDRVALAAFSVVRDLTYWRTLQECLPNVAGPSALTPMEVAE